MSRAKHVVHIDDVPWEERHQSQAYSYRRKRLGLAAEGEKLACNLFEVGPGRSAFPMHAHYGNEEAIYVLSGEGTLRLGDERVTVSEGDYVALPARPELAHQLTNTGEAPLRYLCMSTMNYPEVAYYPDSHKIGVMDGPSGKRTLFKLFRADSDVDYWEGE